MNCIYPDHEPFSCIVCGRTVLDRESKRNCIGEQKEKPYYKLTATGKFLIKLHPCDVLAWAIKFVRLKALVEAINKGPCNECQDRQEWMNEMTRRFIWQHFSKKV